MSRAKTAEKFDYAAFEQEAVKRLMAGERLGGKDGIMAPLLQRFIQLGLEGEMDAHLDQERSEGSENRRNGRGRKRIRSEAGVLEIEPPRDRDGSFSPQLVEKRQRQLNTGLDSQILYLYARGSSYSEISEQLEQIYGVEVSPAVISRVTDKVMPLLQEWRTRPLEAVYPFVFLDAIHYKVRDDGRVVNKAVHVVIGVTREGHKDVLGMYLGQAGGESAKFWMQVLSDLKSRGTEDILIACIDNLSGFAEAIGTVYPQTEVQLCIVHQIRNSRKYLSWKDTKAFMADLRRVYGARSRDEAEGQLDKLDQLWGERYPAVIRSWRSNWDLLSAYFRYPPLIRKTIYTTNLIESFNRQLRRVTNTKGAFTSDDALMKLLYLIQDRVSAEWQKPLHNWNQTLRDLSAFFGKRLPLDL